MERTALLVALALAAALALVQSARLWWARAGPRLRLARRRRRAARGERDAERLLTRAGYRVVDRQVQARLEYALDSEPVPVRVRADLLVHGGGRRYLAEVKTGAAAPSLRTSATRRQLLEYAYAFDVDGLLLVDAEAGSVREVRLPDPPAARGGREPPIHWAVALLLGAALGAVGAALATLAWMR